MTEVLLVTSLAKEIRAATEQLKLPVEYYNEQERQEIKTWRRVNVYEQYIPKDIFENDSYYPCVIVEWLDTQDKMRGEEIRSLATVGLSFGVYAREWDGWKDCLHLMQIVRQRVLSVRTLANRFRLTDEVTWQKGQTQPAPFFFGYAELEYNIYQPQEPLPIDRTLSPDLLTVETPKVLKIDALKRRVK